MKNVLFLFFAILTTLIIGCSDPCDGITCGPGVCDDGDCNCPEGYSGDNCEIQDLCFQIDCGNGTCNPDSGACDCNQGYEGEKCETRINDKYIGTWNSKDFQCDGTQIDETLIIVDGDEELQVILTDADVPSVLIKVAVSSESFVIEEQIIEVDGQNITVVGTGTLIDDILTLNVTQSVIGIDVLCSGTFTR